MSHIRTMTSRTGQSGVSLLIVLIALVIIGFADCAAAFERHQHAGRRQPRLSEDRAGRGRCRHRDRGDVADRERRRHDAFQDVAASGYYSTTADACDLTGTRTPDDDDDDVNWTGVNPGDDCNMDALTVAPAGVADDFTVSYVINRVCNVPGDPNAIFGRTARRR